jgi:hypothetical protein
LLTVVVGAAVAAALPGIAGAEVVSSTPAGFSIRVELPVAAPPAAVYGKLFQIGQWWSDDHTYTGAASNMTLRNEPGGCFCERLAGGGFIRHASLEYSDKGKIARLSGALGPLQEMGASGALTFTFLPADKANPAAGTRLVMTYAAGGGYPGDKGYIPLAPLVDAVMKEQVERLKRYVETGRATP